MASPSVLLAAMLAFGPPGGGSGETPVIAPTQPHRGEAAIAPADPAGERAVSEPADSPGDPGADPGSESPRPEVQRPSNPPNGELPSWESEGQPAPTEEPQPTEPETQPETQPGDGQPASWTTPVDPAFVEAVEPVEPVEKPPPGGAGLWGGAAAVFGAMITRQWVTALTCADVFCGYRGNFDRGLSFIAMGMSGAGGWMQGRRIAWKRDRAGEPARNPVGRRAAGWTMFAVGMGGLIADMALYHACYEDAAGPYTQIEGFSYTCRPDLSVVLIDVTALLSATGLGLALSGESQLRARRKLDFSVAPYGGRGQLGLSIGGRF